MSGDVQIVLGVDTSEVKPGLDSVKGEFQGWAGNANAVASATQKLESQLKSFASEQRMQGRISRFYAAELTSIIPAASGAKDALQGLLGVGIEGLAGGVGFGLAIETAKVAIDGVVSAMERSEKIAQAVMDAHTAASRVAADGWDRVRAATELATDAARAYAEASKAASPGIEKAIAAKAKIEEVGAGLFAKVRGYIFGDPSAFNEYVSALEAADREIQQAVSSATQLAAIEAALATEAQKRAQQRAADRIIARDFEADRKASLAASQELANLQGEIQGLAEKHSQAVERIKTDTQITEATRRRMLAVEERQYQLAQKLSSFRRMPAAEEFSGFEDGARLAPGAAAAAAAEEARLKPWMDSVGKGSHGDGFATDLVDPTNMLGSEDALVRIQSFEEAMGKAEKKGIDLAEAGSAISEAFGAVGSAIGGVGGAIAGQIGNIVQLTLKFIGLAIAAAEASAAQTPVVGWIAAAAAGVGVAASIIGLMGSVGARANGGPIDAYQPYLVGERGPELVVPRSSGTVVPAGSFGGSTVVLNVNAIDAQSFADALDRHDGALVRKLERLGRAGRIG